MEELFAAVGDAAASTDDGEQRVIEVESMCPVCQENGMTRLILVVIPFFREVILSSFSCNNEECNESNSSVQFGGQMQPSGCVYELHVDAQADLNRQLVRSEFSTLRIPELDFEIPGRAGQGEITTVEGILSVSVDNLGMDQERRREEHPEIAEKIDAFITQLKECLQLQRPFTIELRDPSGNSFIQNLHAPATDPKMTCTHFKRSHEDNVRLDLANPDDDETHTTSASSTAQPEAAPIQPAEDYNSKRDAQQEQAVDDAQVTLGCSFAELCYACNRPGTVNMAVVDIPHFKETVIMSFKCDECGFKSTEVKTGGVVPDKGTRMELRVCTPEDLSRDVLKSVTCMVQIPELEFEMSEGTLGSMFTTVEGLITQMYNQLRNAGITSFGVGDAAMPAERQRFAQFFARLEAMKSGGEPFTLIMEDPLSHSYLQSLADDGNDERLTVSSFERTEEQDEELGVTALRELDRSQHEAEAAAAHE